MSIRTIFIVLVSILLSACSYHSRLPRGIYPTTAQTEKIRLRVLVPSDKIAQKQFIFKDYHAKSSVHSYTIDLKDGSLVAAADALGTVFTEVEVNPSSTAKNYEMIAELDYRISDGKNDSDESIQWLNYAQIPYLETRVQLSFFSPEGEEIFVGYATRRNRVELNNTTAVTQRAETSGGLVLLPITSPIYTQQMGDSLRYTLSRDLVECLREIMTQIPLYDFKERQNYVK